MTDPWPGMKIVSRSDERVVTTGADWHFDGEDAEASQRIGVERPLLRLRGIGSCDTDVRADSVLVLRARRATEIRVEVRFEPVYRARHRGRWLAADEQGGVGVYPLRSRLVTRTSSLRLDAGDEAWIAAFPPRERSAHREAQRIAHEGRPTPFPVGAYPGRDVIAESAAHCDVFCLHAYFWKACDPTDRPRIGRYAGRRCSWCTRHHEPEDPVRFRELRAAVREHGMEFVVYLSPEHTRAPDIAAEMERVVGEYDVDGLYLDGVSRDLPTLHRTVSRARSILGPRRILYLNASDQPFGSPRVYAPFVDAYCDFVLRGDAGRGGLSRDTFLRYAVSGRNLSNAVGVWCHYGSAGRPVLRERMPAAADVRAARAAGATVWRRSQAWREVGDDPAAFDAID